MSMEDGLSVTWVLNPVIKVSDVSPVGPASYQHVRAIRGQCTRSRLESCSGRWVSQGQQSEAESFSKTQSVLPLESNQVSVHSQQQRIALSQTPPVREE